MKKILYIYIFILFNILLSQNDGIPPNLIPISSSSDYYKGSDIMIESFVEDQSDIRDVLLFYKFEKSDKTFQVVSMSPFSNVYQGTIPANEVNNEKFEYYVMAIDEFGNQATWPDQSLYGPNVYMLSDSALKDESDLNKKIESKVEINLISPAKLLQKNSVNKSIKFVKMGKIKLFVVMNRLQKLKKIEFLRLDALWAD